MAAWHGLHLVGVQTVTIHLNGPSLGGILAHLDGEDVNKEPILINR